MALDPHDHGPGDPRVKRAAEQHRRRGVRRTHFQYQQLTVDMLERRLAARESRIEAALAVLKASAGLTIKYERSPLHGDLRATRAARERARIRAANLKALIDLNDATEKNT